VGSWRSSVAGHRANPPGSRWRWALCGPGGFGGGARRPRDPGACRRSDPSGNRRPWALRGPGGFRRGAPQRVPVPLVVRDPWWAPNPCPLWSPGSGRRCVVPEGLGGGIRGDESLRGTGGRGRHVVPEGPGSRGRGRRRVVPRRVADAGISRGRLVARYGGTCRSLRVLRTSPRRRRHRRLRCARWGRRRVVHPAPVAEPAAHGAGARWAGGPAGFAGAEAGDDVAGWFAGGERPLRLGAQRRPRVRPGEVAR